MVEVVLCKRERLLQPQAGAPKDDDRSAQPEAVRVISGVAHYAVFGAGSRRISCATRHAVELAREGVPLNIIQRELGHTNFGTTATPTSAPRRSTSKGSTPRRSSPPSKPAGRR